MSPPVLPGRAKPSRRAVRPAARCGIPAEYEHLNDKADSDPRLYAIPDIHGHAKGEHKAFTDERPIPLSARMLFLWFFHACRRGWPRFLMVSDHMNYLTFEDPAAINLVRRALKLAQAGDLYGAAETASAIHVPVHSSTRRKSTPRKSSSSIAALTAKKTADAAKAHVM